VTPQATCRNHGSLREACKVLFRINCLPPYSDSLMLTAGLPAADTALSFATWTALSGGHTATCSTHLATDQIAANNVAAKAFVVGDPGWTQKNSMPGPPSAKPVKDGGWLAYDAGQGHIYGAKGNKTGDFYSYSPPTDSWRQLELWPLGAEAKPPSKGSVGCADGNGRIYAVKGNNTQGFWMYDAGSNTWTQKANIPLGLTNKKVKGGAGIVWAYKGGIGYPYLLKGYKNEFWRYHTAGDSWHALPEAAVGANLKWDKGSWLAYDGASGIYAHKAKYHEFYRYDTEEDSWGPPLQAMPIPGSAGAKKSKDGGSGAYAAGSIFAFKGGNTQEFWRYSVAGNAWTEKETLPMGPSGKKVKAGAGLVAVSSVLYALKGNKTSEFWMYIPGAFSFTPYASRPTVQELTLMPYASCVMRVSPNPLTTGFATLSITGAPEHLGAGARSISVLDISGRVVRQSAIRNLQSAMPLDIRSISAGVYLVRLSAPGFTATEKLIIQR
jgi:hypothetical protein